MLAGTFAVRRVHASAHDCARLPAMMGRQVPGT